MKFSVLLLYPDYIADTFGQDTYYTFIEDAATPEEAVRLAQAEAVDGTEYSIREDSGNFHPLLVIKGHHSDLLDP